MLRVEAAARSLPGRLRTDNEDNFFLNGIFMRAEARNAGGLYSGQYNEERQLYAVCDGQGGLQHGLSASLLTVARLGELLSSSMRGWPRALCDYIDEISATLPSFNGGDASSGCTLACVYLDGPQIRVAHLGNSRVFFKRKALLLTQVTDDHLRVPGCDTQGMRTPEKAGHRSAHGHLLRFLGAPDAEGRTPEISDSMRLKRGDVFLLCSDGLSDMISISEMDAEVSDDHSCADVCRSLVALALARGGEDNVTAMMIRAV